EWRLHYPGFCFFVAHLYKDAFSGIRKGCLYISQANILAQADGTRATGYRTNFIIVTIKYGISLTGNGTLVINSKAHKLAIKAFFLYFQKRITANKVALVKLCEPAHTRFQRMRILGNIIAVERKTHLQAQRVSGTQA